MSRPVDAVHREMLSHLPEGWIWRRDTESLLAAVLRPIAEEVADLEATAEAMMDEVDPRTAYHCLADFERVLGPDPCGRDTSAMTVAERQRLAHQRWTARGGQSISYFIGLAAARGVSVTIEEATLSRANVLRAGQRLVNHPEQFVWVVRLSLGSWRVFRAGASVAGNRLYDFSLSDIECDIRRRAPAHTLVVFHYMQEA